MGRQRARERSQPSIKNSGPPMSSQCKRGAAATFSLGDIGSCGNCKVCAPSTCQSFNFSREGEKSIFLCEISRLKKKKNTGPTFFNTLCRFNETCPVPGCYYCPILALNPFNTFHFLDKDLMIKTFIYILIVTYNRALNCNSKPKTGFFSLPLFQVITKIKEGKKESQKRVE